MTTQPQTRPTRSSQPLLARSVPGSAPYSASSAAAASGRPLSTTRSESVPSSGVRPASRSDGRVSSYRTARGAFEAYDKTLTHAALTLGRSRTWAFWRVQMPCCAQGVLAGAVLAFARALGEYGATAMICGYTPGQTATVSTTVYQLWRTGDDALALKWVLVNVAISAVVLLAMNWLEGRARTRGGRA